MIIQEIKPYKDNPKRHSEEQIKAIAKSLKSFGWKQPIVVDKNNEIIIDHGRYFAYTKYPEGIKEPWIIMADDLTDSQVKELRLADNKLNESEWIMPLLLEEIKLIPESELDLTGFDKSIIIDNEGFIPNLAPDQEGVGVTAQDIQDGQDDIKRKFLQDNAKLDITCPECGAEFKINVQ